MTQQTRIDKWLWATRFFKTRALAKAAIEAGHVQCDGVRAKPSRPLKVGDQLDIRRGQQRYQVTVEVLCGHRGSATVAAGCYTESSESIAERERQTELRRLQRADKVGPDRRPDKRQRRAIHRFKTDTN